MGRGAGGPSASRDCQAETAAAARRRLQLPLATGKQWPGAARQRAASTGRVRSQLEWPKALPPSAEIVRPYGAVGRARQGRALPAGNPAAAAGDRRVCRAGRARSVMPPVLLPWSASAGLDALRAGPGRAERRAQCRAGAEWHLACDRGNAMLGSIPDAPADRKRPNLKALAGGGLGGTSGGPGLRPGVGRCQGTARRGQRRRVARRTMDRTSRRSVAPPSPRSRARIRIELAGAPATLDKPATNGCPHLAVCC
jgi:hypothetical protein